MGKRKELLILFAVTLFSLYLFKSFIEAGIPDPRLGAEIGEDGKPEIFKIHPFFKKDSNRYYAYAKTLAGMGEEVYKPFRPVYPFISSLFLRIDDRPEFMRILPLFSGILLPFVAYFFFKRTGIEKPFIATIFLTTNYEILFNSLFVMPDVPALLFALLAMIFWFDEKDLQASLFFTLSMLTKETFAVFLIGAAVFDFAKRRIWKRRYWIIPVIALLVLIPSYLSWFDYIVNGWTVDNPDVGVKAALYDERPYMRFFFLSMVILYSAGFLLPFTPLFFMECGKIRNKIVSAGSVGAIILFLILLSIDGYTPRHLIPTIPFSIFFFVKNMERKVKDESLLLLSLFIILTDVYSSGLAIVLRNLF
jgi:hypothetical protein